MLGAGKRTERITIIEKTYIPDGAGGNTEGLPVTVISTLAKYRQKNISAEMIANYPDMIGMGEFEIPYRQDVIIKHSHFVEWRGRESAIISIEPDLVRRQKIVIGVKFSNQTTDNGDPA